MVLNHPTLTTQRLLLRELGRQDLDTIFILRSDPLVNKYIKREPAKSIADAEAFLNRITQGYKDSKNFNWSITFLVDEKMIGSVCLWNFSPDRKIAELGYDLLPQFHGKGIMTEATTAVLNFGFGQLGLEKIEAFTHRLNQSSKNLLLKHGFKLDPTRNDDDNSDNEIYEIQHNKWSQFS